jgi:hypothetical protein
MTSSLSVVDGGDGQVVDGSETLREERFQVLESTLSRWERVRLGSVPQSYLPAYKRAVLGESSPRSAIKAYCNHCVGWGGKAEVKNCTAKACPLYAFRPYQKSSKTLISEKV